MNIFVATIKVGYNNQGYFELSFITNKNNYAFWSQMTLNYVNFLSYNESLL
jgi:hypothetical protein